MYTCVCNRFNAVIGYLLFFAVFGINIFFFTVFVTQLSTSHWLIYAALGIVLCLYVAFIFYLVCCIFISFDCYLFNYWIMLLDILVFTLVKCVLDLCCRVLQTVFSLTVVCPSVSRWQVGMTSDCTCLNTRVFSVYCHLSTSQFFSCLYHRCSSASFRWPVTNNWTQMTNSPSLEASSMAARVTQYRRNALLV